MKPRLEEWVVRAAKEAGLALKKYGLVEDPEILHEEINYKLDRFRKLLEELALKSDMSIQLGAEIRARLSRKIKNDLSSSRFPSF